MKHEFKKTPLYEEHLKLKATMIEFAGYWMPVQYEGVIEEHVNVREKVGIFDVSHMGEIWVTGEKTTDWLQSMVTNNIITLEPFQAQYNALLYPEGTVVDDLLVYKFDNYEYLLCVNAANMEKDYLWLLDHVQHGVTIENKSPEYAQIAIQGPAALTTLQPLTPVPLESIKYYRFMIGKVCNQESIISRTGYTGEDGFEVYVKNEGAVEIWKNLMNSGQPHGIKPAGLAARDTLRLEAGMNLYGNDMDQSTTALEAALDWIVKFDKEDFIGKSALLEQKEKGLKRKLVGFEMSEPGIARHGSAIVTKDGTEIGYVSSGTFSPFLKKSIGMAYVPIESINPGTGILIDIRGKAKKATVVTLPFYSRKRKK